MNKEIRYVVLRDNRRVSDQEYLTPQEAQVEYDHWEKILRRWPDGTDLEVREIER